MVEVKQPEAEATEGSSLKSETAEVLAWADKLLGLTDPLVGNGEGKEEAKKNLETGQSSSGKSSPVSSAQLVLQENNSEPTNSEAPMSVKPTDDPRKPLSSKFGRPWLLPPKSTEDFRVDCSDSGSMIFDQEVRFPFPVRKSAGLEGLEGTDDGDLTKRDQGKTSTLPDAEGEADKKLLREDKLWSGKETFSVDSINHDLEWNKATNLICAGQAVDPFVKIVQKQVRQTSTFKDEKWTKTVQSFKFLGVEGEEKLKQWKNKKTSN